MHSRTEEVFNEYQISKEKEKEKERMLYLSY